MRAEDYPKVRDITGKITLLDGSISEFNIDTGLGWNQWGAVQERLGATVDTMEALVAGLADGEVMATEDEERAYDEAREDDPAEAPALTESQRRDMAKELIYREGQGVVHLDGWIEILGELTEEELGIPLRLLADMDTEAIAKLIQASTVRLPPAEGQGRTVMDTET